MHQGLPLAHYLPVATTAVVVVVAAAALNLFLAGVTLAVPVFLMKATGNDEFPMNRATGSIWASGTIP